MKNFLEDVFMKKYYHRLEHRKESFKKIFYYLDSLKKEKYNIIETGIARIAENYVGDGMSTLMYDEFINYYDGNFITIDINYDNILFAKNHISDKTRTICGDSVVVLNNIKESKKIDNIDLLYLDSFDIDFNNPHPSAMHHVKELLAIKNIISEGTLIVVDDNFNGSGKGKYVDEFMTQINKNKYFDEYQIGWIY